MKVRERTRIRLRVHFPPSRPASGKAPKPASGGHSGSDLGTAMMAGQAGNWLCVRFFPPPDFRRSYSNQTDFPLALTTTRSFPQLSIQGNRDLVLILFYAVLHLRPGHWHWHWH